MRTYAKNVSRKKTPQTEAIPGTTQVENSAGGFVWAVDCWTQLDRFLIIGTEGGSYYASEKDMVIKNSKAVEQCCAADGRRTVDRIVEVSHKGLAPKNDPAIFALAVCASIGDVETRRYALENLSQVCRIGTHVLQFIANLKEMRGNGRAVRRAIRKWYQDRDLKGLCYQLVKYQDRAGWSHGDVFRQFKVRPDTEERSEAFFWSTRATRPDAKKRDLKVELPYISAFEEAKTADPKTLVRLITDQGLTREMLPTEALNRVEVWDALLQNMPLNALVRNLGKMTSIGLIKPLSDAAKLVQQKLSDEAYIRKSRLHPISILVALKVYAQGKGVKGSLTWSPVTQVSDALDSAFYKGFQNVEATNLNYLLALDVSGSMGCSNIKDMLLTPREASAALALVTANVEPNYQIVGFCGHLVELDISPKMRLDQVIRKIDNLPFGSTDCSLPMIYAMKNSLGVDMFAVYTDSETYAGRVHPCQALKDYRLATNRPKTKSVVVGMVSNGFTIADPNDPGMLDVVGFSTDTPAALAAFAAQ